MQIHDKISQNFPNFDFERHKEVITHLFQINGILFSKLFKPTVRKKCSSDREKKMKFEAEGQ